MSTVEIHGAPKAPLDWAHALLPYSRASAARGVFELAVTVLPFVALWAAMLIAARHGQVWLSLALAPLAAVLLVRLFMIQHDCGPGSFLPSKAANEWIGRGIGIVTMTPYDHWRRCHAIRSRRKTRSGTFGARPVDTFQLKRRSASSWKGCAGRRA
jgi:omega-6 fatty acid desaturase (delta-12 desaturase)